MTDEKHREPARDPQDLERLLVSWQRSGDVEGMVKLYEFDAGIDCGNGQLVRGKQAIGTFYSDLRIFNIHSLFANREYRIRACL